jgi:hypothetical protein
MLLPFGFIRTREGAEGGIDSRLVTQKIRAFERFDVGEHLGCEGLVDFPDIVARQPNHRVLEPHAGRKVRRNVAPQHLSRVLGKQLTFTSRRPGESIAMSRSIPSWAANIKPSAAYHLHHRKVVIH